jgi:RNA polymerase sigma factor (sigma-70 family)
MFYVGNLSLRDDVCPLPMPQLNRIHLPADYPGGVHRSGRVREVGEIFDEMLILYAQAGRREALERLACRWRPRHLSHARRLLGSADRAADAVQDAWISIVRGLWQLKEPERFPAWSYAIVTRRCQDLMRRVSRENVVPLPDDIEDEKPSDVECAGDLRAGLNSLPREQQAAVSLFYKDGFGVTEIAQALGVPAGTVKSRLFHARRTLRRYLTGEST